MWKGCGVPDELPQGRPSRLTAGVGRACELAHVLPLAQVAGQAAAKTAEASKKTTECNVQWSGKGGAQQSVWLLVLQGCSRWDTVMLCNTSHHNQQQFTMPCHHR